MVNPVLVAIVITLVIYWFYKSTTNRPENFPPGMPRLPIWGSYWFILAIDYKFVAIALQKLAKFYKSSIIGFYLGNFICVAVSKHKEIKEMLNNKDFDGRVDLMIGRLRDPDFDRHGIFFADGPLWFEQRRFALRHMRDFGFGRRSKKLEAIITEELNDMISLLRDGPKEKLEDTYVKNGCARIPDIFYAGCTNSFLPCFTSDRFPRSQHHELVDAARGGKIFNQEGDDLGRALSHTPWIRHIFPNASGFKPLQKGNSYMYNLIKKHVDRNIETYQPNDERNFIDIYLNEMNKRNENGKYNSFSYKQLLLTGTDFLFPVATAMTMQMAFIIRHIVVRPDIMKKMQDEMDKAVGRGRLVSLDYRNDIPYTNAVIRETMRIETLVPLLIPHRAQVDSAINGYSIPENTVICGNLYNMHLDPDLWEDPESFKPERFFKKDGSLMKINEDYSLPFGAGKRLCAGETFARQTMMLFIANLLHHFNLSVPDGQSLPDLEKSRVNGIITTIKEFWIQVSPRP